MFRKNRQLKDPRSINMMVSRGYMELEETLMQFKQKSHVSVDRRFFFSTHVAVISVCLWPITLGQQFVVEKYDFEGGHAGKDVLGKVLRKRAVKMTLWN